jgi:periplasmic protein TonB
MQAGLLVKRVTPEYPAVAKAARIQGRVRFSAIIGRDGRIQDLKPTGGPSILIPPASAAVKQWIYRPTLLNGQPVEVATQIEVNFTLAQ